MLLRQEKMLLTGWHPGEKKEREPDFSALPEREQEKSGKGRDYGAATRAVSREPSACCKR